jgi:hypothetical protein
MHRNCLLWEGGILSLFGFHLLLCQNSVVLAITAGELEIGQLVALRMQTLRDEKRNPIRLRTHAET